MEVVTGVKTRDKPMKHKGGINIAVFMHMIWERVAFVLAILMPPLCILVLIVLMASEASYTYFNRLLFFQ